MFGFDDLLVDAYLLTLYWLLNFYLSSFHETLVAFTTIFSRYVGIFAYKSGRSSQAILFSYETLKRKM